MQALLTDGLAAAGTPFLVVFLAEFGDKSQLVCMTLAARYRPWPVLTGATLAFALLNLLAVLFGASLARWVPEFWLALGVAILFGLFGVQGLAAKAEPDSAEELTFKQGRGVLVTALMLILVAEFGDKTQLAVAGLGSAQAAVPVWAGSTLALFTTSALGVIAGRTLLQRFPVTWLQRSAGVLFLLLAAVALLQAFGALEIIGY